MVYETVLLHTREYEAREERKEGHGVRGGSNGVRGGKGKEMAQEKGDRNGLLS